MNHPFPNAGSATAPPIFLNSSSSASPQYQGQCSSSSAGSQTTSTSNPSASNTSSESKNTSRKCRSSWALWEPCYSWEALQILIQVNDIQDGTPFALLDSSFLQCLPSSTIQSFIASFTSRLKQSVSGTYISSWQ